MDGTLVDSGDLHYLAWREAMQAHGRDLTRAEFDATFGQRNDTILRRLLDPAITAEDIARIGDEKEADYRALVAARGIQPLAGALEWVRRLGAAGWRQAIASSGPRANADTIVDALGLHGAFAALASAEDVTHGKPHPEVFLVAAARVDVAPARCVVVEDAPPGIEAGRRAGMPTIGVLSTHAKLEADRVVAALTDLEADAFDRLITR